LTLAALLAACSPGGRSGGAAPARTNEVPAHPAPAAPPTPERAFDFDPALFARKRPPAPGDWLAEHDERAQPFDAYAHGQPTRPTPGRRSIVLQPLGPLSPPARDLLEALGNYLAVFFQLPTRVAAPVPLPALGARTRREGGTSWAQYRTDILIDQVLAPRLPTDAVCLLGVTMADLTPAPSWNYVFGSASFDRRVGVYSLARLGPLTGSPAARAQTLRRAMLVVAHETGHMFSLPHCVRYECLMNGSNSLAELDRGTLWLCPDCLRKLQWNIGFDVRQRYRALRAFFSARGVPEAVAWIDRRLARLDARPG